MSASASNLRRGAALLAALIALSVGGEAVAKRIVMLDFVGPRARRFQRTVGRMVADDHTVIRSRRYERAARRLRAGRPTPRNVRRVARKLRADGIVIGKVRRRRGRFVLEVRVRSGRSGKFVGPRIRARVRRARLAGRAAQRVNRKLSRVLRRLGRLNARRDRDRRDRDRSRRDRARDRRDRDRRDRDRERDRDPERDRVADRAPDRDRRDRGRDRDRDRDGGEDPDVSAERRADLEARSRGLDVEAGLAGLNRNLGFSVATDLGEQAPQGYSGSFVPAAFLRAELYPFAFSLESDSPKRDIGLSAVYEKVLQIESQVPMSDVVLPTDQQRYAVGLVYRKNFGDDPTSPTLKVIAHYNQASFTLDKGPAQEMGITVDVPNVTYTYFDPGLGLRYPFSEKVALNAGAHFLFITSTGEMQQEDQYGSATVTGFDLDANLEYRLKPRLLLRVGGRAMGFAFDFDGNGALTDRNGDMTQDVGGAFDRYLGGYATLGYLF